MKKALHIHIGKKNSFLFPLKFQEISKFLQIRFIDHNKFSQDKKNSLMFHKMFKLSC